MSLMLLIAAFLPALILLYHIYGRDKYRPEPPVELLKGFGWGMLATLLAMAVETPLSYVEVDHNSVAGSFYQAFVCAAIPEECVKALCLYLFLRHSRYFDEYMDGIVYAVAVGMGFAGLENVGYLSSFETSLSLVAARALLAVPAHFAFAVLMGYFFSLWRIHRDRTCFVLMLVAPVLAHGLYDFLLFTCGTTGHTGAILLLTISFVVLLHYLRKQCSRLIEKHLAADSAVDKDSSDENLSDTQ